MAPLGIQVVDRLAGWSPVPLTVWGPLCLLLHKVVCGSGSWGAQWPSQPALMLAQRGHCWGASIFPGLGTRPAGITLSPLNKHSRAAIPSGNLLLGDSISLSGWKIFRGYYFSKGWPPPSPLVVPISW